MRSQTTANEITAKARARREENAVRRAVRKVLSSVQSDATAHPIPPDWASNIIVELMREPGEWGIDMSGGESKNRNDDTTTLVCAVLEDKVLLRATRTACISGPSSPYYKISGPRDALRRIGDKALDRWIREKCRKLQLRVPPKGLLKHIEFIWGTHAAVLMCKTYIYIATVYGYWAFPRYLGYYPSMHSNGDAINVLAEKIGVTPITAKRILCAQISREEFEAEIAVAQLRK